MSILSIYNNPFTVIYRPKNKKKTSKCHFSILGVPQCGTVTQHLNGNNNLEQISYKELLKHGHICAHCLKKYCLVISDIERIEKGMLYVYGNNLFDSITPEDMIGSVSKNVGIKLNDYFKGGYCFMSTTRFMKTFFQTTPDDIVLIIAGKQFFWKDIKEQRLRI